jgi:hypothetical protein
MSLMAMSLVWKYSRQKGTKLLLMLALADHCNDDLICWPGRKHLAEKIRMSERYTKDLIDNLLTQKPIELLLLEEGGGRGHSPHYRIVLSDRKGEAGLPLSEIKGEAGPDKGGGGPRKGGGGPPERGRRASPEPSLTIINPPTLTDVQKTAAAVDIGWVWSSLSKSSKIGKAKREALEVVNPSPSAFVSKYLYALAHPGFRKPALWAAVQLADDPAEYAGEPFRTLAQLGPGGLANVLAWLRDDAAYPLKINGAIAAAFAFRGHLQARYQKQPAGLYVAVDDAINDLGLDALAAPSAVASESEVSTVENAAAIPTQERDPWQAMVDEMAKSLPAAAIDRLRSCSMVRTDESGTVIAAPSEFEMSWLTRMLARQLGERNISIQLVETTK